MRKAGATVLTLKIKIWILSDQVYPAGCLDNYYNLTDLKAGIYFYKIDIDNEMFYGKLIKKWENYY